MAAPGASVAGRADWLGDGGCCCDAGGDPGRDGGLLECRRFEVAGVGVEIRQDLRGSHALRPLDDDRPAPRDGNESPPPLILTGKDLARVGLVVWQAGFVLGDLLLRRPPYGSWHGATVLDLGCGTGLVGILLCLAGADVTLTDQPHITPLARLNAMANLTPGLHRARVVDYVWGSGRAGGGGDAAAVLLPPPPIAGPALAAAAAATAADHGTPSAPPPPLQQSTFDAIVASDVVYEPAAYAALAATLRVVAAPHTLVFLAFKSRGLQESSLLGMLEDAGFAITEVPQAHLAPEYQTCDGGGGGGDDDGGTLGAGSPTAAASTYRVLRACLI